jgi:NAD(P)H dehydrogenase (quinone)
MRLAFPIFIRDHAGMNSIGCPEKPGTLRLRRLRQPARRLNAVAVLVACLSLASSAPLAEAGDVGSGKDPAPPQTRILVVYYSLRGTTKQMAEAVAEGVRRVPTTRAVLRRVEEATKADLEAADGIVLGCPTYFANIPGAMKEIMDDWNWKWEVDFTDKVGGAFATGGGQVGGKEHVMVSLLLFMLSNRMVVAGPLYEDEEGEDIWGEPGAAAMTGPLDPGVSEGELDSARRLGERVARLAKRFHPR